MATPERPTEEMKRESLKEMCDNGIPRPLAKRVIDNMAEIVVALDVVVDEDDKYELSQRKNAARFLAGLKLPSIRGGF